MWKPAPDIDPTQIRWELDSDREAGKYEDALAKQVWFHRHVPEIRPSMSGVRLSYALGSWMQLAEVYPPALEEMFRIRDETGERLRSVDRDRRDFIDFKAINFALEQQHETDTMFTWLHDNAPEFAKEIYDVAEPVLVRFKRYHLCGEYISKERGLKLIEDNQKAKEGISKHRPELYEEMLNFVREQFRQSVRTLVALLAVNGRQNEASGVVDAVLREDDDLAFTAELETARAGEVPEPQFA